MIQVYWAVPPGKWTLKGMEEVSQDPGQDHVVEQSNQEGHQHRSHACFKKFNLININYRAVLSMTQVC